MSYTIYQNYGYTNEVDHGDYEHLEIAIYEMNQLADDFEDSAASGDHHIFEVANFASDGEYRVHARRDIE